MRILLVEDEPEFGAYMKRSLEGSGFSVDVARDGEEGLWLAGEVDYDVVVLDVMLPKLNGYQVCAELRARENWVPVLMLTAKDGALDEAEGLDTGADDYLTKPAPFVVLLARIRALVRRTGDRRPAVLEVGRLRLDPARHEFRVAGRVLDLTPTEFAIMELFMRNSGRVLSRAEILENCWDWAYEGAPNIVAVYIRRLRSKLATIADFSFISTVRGAGYLLDDDADD